MNIFLESLKSERKVSYSPKNNILPAEKIIAVLSYFTSGIVGFVWVIIGTLTKQNLRPFLKYHLFQSIFLAILFFIISQAVILVLNVLGFIPFVNVLVLAITFAFNVSIINLPHVHLSIIQVALLALTIYLSLGVINGKYSYIPWVSDIIKHNIGR